MVRATIKLAGRPANRRIFLAFTTNHVAAENAVDALSLPFRELFTAQIFLERERKLHGRFLQRRSKQRCKTDNSLRQPSPFGPFFPPMILRPLSKPFWVKHSKRAETTFPLFFSSFWNLYILQILFFFFLRVLSFLRFNFLNGDFVWRERKYIDNNLEEIEKRCIFIQHINEANIKFNSKIKMFS